MENLNDVNWNGIAVTVGVIAVVTLCWWQPAKDYFRGLKMRQKRREEIQHLVSSKLVDFIEDCVAAGNLTREEATKEVYEPLKRVYNCHKDLYPAEQRMKEGIKKRLQSGTHEPVTLPPVKRKNLFGR